jgi:hypothetical protein
MIMEPTEMVGAAIWLVMMVLAGFALYRVKTRRSHIGSAAAGTIYDIVQDEKRKAIEIVVSDKAAARDFEHADDDDDPPSIKQR